ncbi:large conductance mechanosensitive channel protein MscL [Robertmurraya korlensis]|uniref:large conductance mechanosensitive channel protein MscL n=1 Tax=Robertmurraya korlensis TaxID=519977 RepID=UPI000A017B61|nr:large conductance mechanosensitive channel protein MscL [Robertmurraya korlensis]
MNLSPHSYIGTSVQKREGTTIRFLRNFKEFATRGTVVEMAIGVIVGTAFVKMVDSFVKDIITPPLGLILGRVNFSNMYISLTGKSYTTLAEAREAGAITVNYGVFIGTIIDFAIISLATYFVLLQIGRLKKAPVVSIPVKECPFCLANIPAKAIRCSQCTSHLTMGGENQTGEQDNDKRVKIHFRQNKKRLS